jgi:hypothetical protein
MSSPLRSAQMCMTTHRLVFPLVPLPSHPP